MGGEYTRRHDIERERLEGSGYERSGCPCADCEDQAKQPGCADCGRDNDWEMFTQATMSEDDPEIKRKDTPRGINFAFAAVNDRYGRTQL